MALRNNVVRSVTFLQKVHLSLGILYTSKVLLECFHIMCLSVQQIVWCVFIRILNSIGAPAPFLSPIDLGPAVVSRKHLH